MKRTTIIQKNDEYMDVKPRYTVGQLIEMLQKFPRDMPVVMDAFESDYKNVMPPRRQLVNYCPDDDYYIGQFQWVTEGVDGAFEVVVIPREVRL